MDYKEFIKNKQKLKVKEMIDISSLTFNRHLKDFQLHSVKWALKIGRTALFEDCGLGKTIQLLEWCNQINKYTKMPTLILSPLAVVGQTIQEHEKFSIDTPIERITKSTVYENKIYISNYEQLNNIDCSIFGGVVLDESGILKNYSGSTKQLILEKFLYTKYKLACTATPSPNDHIELGNHAEFLGVMKSREMVSRFFINDCFNKDVTQKSKWRLKKSARNDFWSWVNTWALMIGKPSDIGYSDDGYNLPPLTIKEEKIEVEEEVEDGYFFNTGGISATEYHGRIRHSIKDRAELAKEIVKKYPNEPIIIWIKQDAEGEVLRNILNGCVEVKGSDKPEQKEKHLLGFKNGDFRILITKKKIAKYGLNYQICSKQIDLSVDFSFEEYYQAVRRSYRFGQDKEVYYFMITTNGMENVIQSLKRKHEQFEEMKKEMYKSMNKIRREEINHMDYIKEQKEDYAVYLGDSIDVIKGFKDESIGMSIFSPPFSDLYLYSDDPRDVSNCQNYGEFAEHFTYLVKELLRVTETGRHCVMHCTQLGTLLSKEGYQSTIDFRGDLIRMMTNNGWDYFSEVVIWKDAENIAKRTNHPQLLHGSTKRDSTKCRMAFPDYMLSFRKRGETINPVRNNLPRDEWGKIAQPVWMDINPTDTLRMPAKDADSEKHMTPTQLEPLRRFIKLYTNEYDTVLDPFSGIGSSGVCALELKRKYIGVELKENYYNQSLKHLNSALEKSSQLRML